MSQNLNIFFFLRIAFGMLFILSGGEKLLSPYQNFLYVVQSYKIFPDGLETAVALTIPWIELFLGLFLVLGLWLRHALSVLLILLAGFIVIVAQAMMRHLPIEECGCFGGLLSLPLHLVLLMDSILLLLAIKLNLSWNKVASLSLDHYFAKD